MAERLSKHKRQEALLALIEKEPFLTDEELSLRFGVSVPTIRLDRMEKGISQVRERLEAAATERMKKLRSITLKEIMGELLYIDPGKEAISILDTTADMLFENAKVVRGQNIYAMAETLAIAVIDANAALIGIANIKYKRPIPSGVRLTARAEVRQKKGNKSIVWVKITQDSHEVFAGKFILSSIEGERS